jgi:hypothetical protein
MNKPLNDEEFEGVKNTWEEKKWLSPEEVNSLIATCESLKEEIKYLEHFESAVGEHCIAEIKLKKENAKLKAEIHKLEYDGGSQ